MHTEASRVPLHPAAPVGADARPALALRDYVAAGGIAAEGTAGDGGLQLRREAVAGYADPAPGGLFAHPAWLRAYVGPDPGAELVVVEALRPGAPRLVFARERGGLVHRGRLLRLEAALVADLGARLMRQTEAAFAVFEDVEVVGAWPPGPPRLTFRYQNNWRLDLRGGAWRGKQLVVGTKRKARGLRRDAPDVSIQFEPAPDRAVLDRIVAFGRARFAARGRRYGIDAAEAGRLAAVSAAVGHGTLVRSGDALLAGDLVCVVGDQAYFLTHGYDTAHPRSRLGMVCLVNSIEACAERGVADFNLLWGDLPYKAQLGAERAAIETVILRRPRAALLAPGYLAAVRRFGWLDLKRRLKPLAASLMSLAARLRARPAGDAAGKA